VIEDFRIHYNTQRPHSKLGYRSPVKYADQLSRSPAQVGLRPTSAGDRQTTTLNTTSTHRSD
jgi:hypothetical protein